MKLNKHTFQLMKKNFIILIILTSYYCNSQSFREMSYDMFAGANYSVMSNLPDVIVPKGLYSGYSLEESPVIGITAGVSVNFFYPYAKISIQPQVFFSKQSTDLKYKDDEGLNYNMQFGFSYINVGVLFKYYPVEQLYIGAGPNFGLNLNPDGITYTSNGAQMMEETGVYFEPDIVVQKYLKESLSGTNHLFASFALGYEFSNNITICAKYNLGLSDALATEENGFRYTENKNKITSFSLTLGYIFSLDDKHNF